MSKKVKGWKKIVAVGAITATLGLGFWASKAFYTVTGVFDGDTFITKEHQYVRLDSVNAPELDNCLGKEAKTELEKLVLNKKVFVKVSYIDGMRLVASVFTVEGNVGSKMLKNGLATFEDKGNQPQPGMLKIAQNAREKGIGIYSPTCTQSVNPVSLRCNIKGNIRGKDMLYRYPGCGQYNNTLIQLYLGDKWFCTEKEAKAAGFTKGADCP